MFGAGILYEPASRNGLIFLNVIVAISIGYMFVLAA